MKAEKWVFWFIFLWSCFVLCFNCVCFGLVRRCRLRFRGFSAGRKHPGKILRRVVRFFRFAVGLHQLLSFAARQILQTRCLHAGFVGLLEQLIMSLFHQNVIYRAR